MVERLTGLITEDTKVTGLSVTLSPQGGADIRCLTLELRKGVVSILGKKQWESIEKAEKELDKTIPVALVLNGKGVLHKTVTLSGADQVLNEQMLYTVMPAVKPADFYVQLYQAGKTGFFSLARRETVDKFLMELKGEGVKVIAISFGPFIFSATWPYIREEHGQGKMFMIGEHQLEMGESGIIGYQTLVADQCPTIDSEIVKIGDEQVEHEYVLAYAAAFSKVSGSVSGLQLTVEDVIASQDERRQQKLFRFGFTMALVFFFVLLMGNFLFFGSLSDKNADLQEQVGFHQGNLDKMAAMQKEAAEKRSFLQATGWLHDDRLSFYADRLASTVPAGIRLTEVSLNPLDRKLSKSVNKQIFEQGSMAVLGVCRSPVELNAWMQEIGRQAWVKGVDRRNYTYDQSKGNGTFEFRVKLREGNQ